MHSPLSLHQARFLFPNGREILEPTTLTFNPGLTALIGDNGTGKTTIFRLLRGELSLSSGQILGPEHGDIAYLPQHITLAENASVSQLLGIADILRAIDAITAGSVDQRDYDTVGTSWDIAERARALLDGLGLEDITLDRPVATLSGGQVMLLALVGIELSEAEVVLLDEPTNNLDAQTRERVYDMLTRWKATVVVITHDRALLDRVETIVELYNRQLRSFGGNFTHYEQTIAAEQDAVRQEVTAAKAQVKQEQRLAQALQTKQAHDKAFGKKKQLRRTDPRVVANQRKTEAEKSAGKARVARAQSMEAAQEKHAEISAKLRESSEIHIDLPELKIPSARRMLTIFGAEREYEVYGPMRLAITGANGVGKTLMFRTALGDEPLPHQPYRAVAHTERIGYLPQRISDLLEDKSALENLALVSTATEHQARAQLARFGLRGKSAEAPASQLSGGQRFRLALARLLLAEPAHEMLLLDEPTNNLDLTSRDALISGLSDYRGALVVVSHDADFLQQIGVQDTVEFDLSGSL